MEIKQGLEAAWQEFMFVHRRTEKTPTQIEGRSESFNRQLHAAMGMSGESGEVLELFKKSLWGYRDFQISESDLKKEIGDLVWYVALMLDASGFSLEEILLENAKKLRARYPEKFPEELAVVPN